MSHQISKHPKNIAYNRKEAFTKEKINSEVSGFWGAFFCYFNNNFCPKEPWVTDGGISQGCPLCPIVLCGQTMETWDLHLTQRQPSKEDNEISLSRYTLCWNPGQWDTGLILGLCPTNERCPYFVTTPLIGWVQAYNQHQLDMSTARRRLKWPRSLSGTSAHPTMVTQVNIMVMNGWLTSFSFIANRLSHSWDKAISDSWNSKVKVKGVVKGQGHTISPVSY